MHDNFQFAEKRQHDNDDEVCVEAVLIEISV